jgi:hypothetical protein
VGSGRGGGLACCWRGKGGRLELMCCAAFAGDGRELLAAIGAKDPAGGLARGRAGESLARRLERVGVLRSRAVAGGRRGRAVAWGARGLDERGGAIVVEQQSSSGREAG